MEPYLHGLGRPSVRLSLNLFGVGCGLGYSCKRAVYDFKPYTPDDRLMRRKQGRPVVSNDSS